MDSSNWKGDAPPEAARALSNVCSQASTWPSNQSNAGIPQLPGPNNPPCAPCRRRSGRGRYLVHGIKHLAERRIHAIRALYRDERPALACLRTGHSVTEPTRVTVRERAEEARGDERCARRRGPRGSNGVVEESVAGLGDSEEAGVGVKSPS
jgi:hypothetical protein